VQARTILVVGAIFCLLSAVGFGALPIFGKLAYDEDVSVGDLLIVRFAIAAIIMVTIAWWRGGFHGLSRRSAIAAFLMGAIGYAAQSASFFVGLTRIDASLLTLIFYVYPITVMIGAVALGRERMSVRKVAALAIALLGMTLVMMGAVSAGFDWIGALLGLTAALVYTVYILTGDRVLKGISALPLTALVCVGASTTYLLASVPQGGPQFDFAPMGWTWLLGVSVIGSVGAIVLFFAGLARVGPSVAAILSILEPVTTVSLAALVFGESLSSNQLVGALLVLSSVVVIQLPKRTRVETPLPLNLQFPHVEPAVPITETAGSNR
jgi:drug/metabolite transporter (DMT)-like permease